MDIYSIKVGQNVLIYAPLHHFCALVNPQAAREIRRGLANRGSEWMASLPFIDLLRQPVGPPEERDGPLDPLFLGLVPTRGCNLNCQYCDFAAPKSSGPVMDFSTARQAIEAYFSLQKSAGRQRAGVHFFGGEPFFASALVDFAVEYAALRAGELGLEVRFEVTTNGLFDARRCQWVGDHFDCVVLSLDGPRDIQDCQRPSLGENSVFDRIEANARQLAASPTDLVLRACVTDQTVVRMAEIAAYFSQEIRPDLVCFETLVACDLSQRAGLLAPDPWAFARQFYPAMKILRDRGIKTVLSTANLDSLWTSFCPVGKDALIVSPDGSIDACYLLRQAWEDHGLDFHLGQVEGNRLAILEGAVRNVRRAGTAARPRCADCFCRYHCAGGCHVNHSSPGVDGPYDAACIQTRLVTTALLLDRLGQGDLAESWLADRPAQEAMAWATSDRLVQP
jgi:uncharacterized protein